MILLLRESFMCYLLKSTYRYMIALGKTQVERIELDSLTSLQ